MDKVKIDKLEVLRYLGYSNQVIDKDLHELIDKLIESVQDRVCAKTCLSLYDLDKQDRGILLRNTSLVLTGNDIKKCLEKCDKVYLLAVTLGFEMEKLINESKVFGVLNSVILDSIATAYVEQVCDKIEDEIYNECRNLNKGISFRYSPGYGDLPLNIQSDFIKVLDATRRIGLSVSSSDILIPRKSVTAIIGIKNNCTDRDKHECINCCNYDTCRFRKDGVKCGN